MVRVRISTVPASRRQVETYLRVGLSHGVGERHGDDAEDYGEAGKSELHGW